jgi:hypothetical protein
VPHQVDERAIADLLDRATASEPPRP